MASLDDLDRPRRTERLELRRMTPDDAPDVYAVKTDPALAEWTSRRNTSGEAFVGDVANRCATDLVATWDGRLAGLLMVRVTDGWAQGDVAEKARGSQAELGWTVLPWAQGQGVATEMAAEGLAIAFRLGVRRVVAECFAANAASWRVMERIGMRRELHGVKDSLHHSGVWMDGLAYGILRDEWDGPVARRG